MKTARRVVRAVVAAVVGATAVVACTLDWAVRPDEPAGPGVDAGGRDGDSLPDLGDATADVSSPGSDGGGADCAVLRGDVASKLKAARGCSFQLGECLETVKDECSCDVVVARPDASATFAYLNARDLLVGAKCPLACGSCPSTAARGCLQKPSTVIECTP